MCWACKYWENVKEQELMASPEYQPGPLPAPGQFQDPAGCRQRIFDCQTPHILAKHVANEFSKLSPGSITCLSYLYQVPSHGKATIHVTFLQNWFLAPWS